MWIQERMWQYSLQISLRGKPVWPFFQMQIGLLTVAVRFLGEEFKRKGNTPLGLTWGVPVTLIKWEEGTKDTWRMTPGSRMLHQDWPGQSLMGGGNFYFCGFLLELNHLDFSSSFPLTLAQVFTDFSTESESPLPRPPSQFSCLYSRSARNCVIQLWPTGSYSLQKLFIKPPWNPQHYTRHLGDVQKRVISRSSVCSLFLFLKEKIFIYFWLCWVLVAMCGLSSCGVQA